MDISEPVRIKDEHYLFQVTEKTEFPAPDFESKKAYVRNDLLYSRYRTAWEKVYADLRRDFKVKVNDHNLEHFLKPEDGHGHAHN
jgi:parvulin-like peptidyl-prolyl isomerase